MGEKRACLQCGGEFEGSHHRKYCSQRCSGLASAKVQEAEAETKLKLRFARKSIRQYCEEIRATWGAEKLEPENPPVTVEQVSVKLSRKSAHCQSWTE